MGGQAALRPSLPPARNPRSWSFSGTISQCRHLFRGLLGVPTSLLPELDDFMEGCMVDRCVHQLRHASSGGGVRTPQNTC